MPPEDRFVPRFAAEPPQDLLPYGRWSQTLTEEFLAACLRIDSEGEELGEPDEVTWYPDRTWHGRTFVPATALTSQGYELFGYVSYAPGGDGEEPTDFHSVADYTAETAAANPDWQIDLCDEVVGTWRGEQGKAAAMTLVWGRPLVDGGAVVTGELADLAVDQCPLLEGRFTLLAPDDYRGDTLDASAGARHQLARLDREDRRRRPRGGPHRPVGEQVLVDDRLDRAHVAVGRHAADREAGLLAGEGGVGLLGAEARLVHAVGARRDDEQRLVADPEDQRLADRPHLAADRGSGVRGGARTGRELLDVLEARGAHAAAVGTRLAIS
jgi:hypothetical protein